MHISRVKLSISLHPTGCGPTGYQYEDNMACLYLSGGMPEELKEFLDKLSDEATVTDPPSSRGVFRHLRNAK